jgi:peptidoglycan hydrolase-like protein with peptidoglycan-binding domain
VIRRLSLLAVLVAAAAPAGAIAKPAPAKSKARIGITVAGGFHVDSKQVAVAGRRLRVDGRVVPYVPGQQVTVHVWNGHTLIDSKKVTPKPTSTKQTATFSVRFTPAHSGFVRVFAVHDRTPLQGHLAVRAAFDVLHPGAAPGERSTFVSLIQQQLAATGYATPRSGVYDPLTGLAVLAFRKVNGMARVTTLDPTVVDRLLRGVGGFHVRYPQHGRHVEANLGWQVLALIENGKVVRAYTTSSGKPSTPTVLGSFHFYSKTIGTNAEGMVDSNYFIRGYAIHGYFDVPTYNASHGCLRVPISDARAIFDWVRLGDEIDVYY